MSQKLTTGIELLFVTKEEEQTGYWGPTNTLCNGDLPVNSEISPCWLQTITVQLWISWILILLCMQRFDFYGFDAVISLFSFILSKILIKMLKCIYVHSNG
jgi:hypothetical protein